MEKLIFTFLALVPGLYLLGRFYSDFRGKERSGNLNLDEVRDNIRKSNGFWEWLVPIAISFAFLYNIVATAAWMAAELVQLGLTAAKWTFTNIFITGPWFLVRMGWHYLVIWPWKLLRTAFGEIIPSLSRSQFMTAFLGITLSLIIYFIGAMDSEGPEWLSYIMSVLSVFPLGWAVGKIGLAVNGKDYTSVERNNYFKHLGFLIALFGILTLAEAFLINLGTRTSMSSALSHLFLFGSFWGSALLLFNGVILLFALSALPFISANFNGDYKELLFASWNHIKAKGLRYVVALPAMLIPIALLGIIPTLLTEGINHISNTVTSEVYSDRLDSLSIEEPQVISVYDLQVSEDSIKNYFSELKEYYSATVNKRAIELDRDAITGILSENSDETAALPYYLVFGLIDTLNSAQSNAMALNHFKIGTNDLSEASNGLKEGTLNRAKSAEEDVKQAITRLEYVNSVKELTCNPPEEKDPTPNQDDVEDAGDEMTDEGSEPYQMTECDKANERVKSAQGDFNDAEKVKARADFIAAQAEGLHNHVEGLSSSTGWSTKLAWALGSFFLALLFALQFGLPLVLFARVNARIYGEDDDNSIVLLDSIKSMQSENKNQPLLGLGITALIYLMYTGSSLMSFDLPDLPSPVKSSIDYSIDLYEDILGSDGDFYEEIVDAYEGSEETVAEEAAAEEAAVEDVAIEEYVEEEVAADFGFVDTDGDGRVDRFMCSSGRLIPINYVNDGDCDCEEYCEDENV